MSAADDAEVAVADVMYSWNLARRWAALKTRVLRLRREREKCEAYEPSGFGYAGEPVCWDAAMPRADEIAGLEFSEWCGACQRNQARYLYRQYTQKALAGVQRKLLRALAS